MTKSTLLAAFGVAAVTGLAACSQGQDAEQIRQQAEKAVADARAKAQETMAQAENKVDELMAKYSPMKEDVPQRAVAILHPTAGNEVSGTVTFTPAKKGLTVSTEASGLTPGEHGYHLHIYGDCTAEDGTSAGTHFNLEGSSLNPPEDIDRITGDLGNLDAGEDGTASHEAVLENAKLTGAKSIIGRAVVVHAKPNDPNSPPIGAAGSRQACGVIGIANPEG